MQRKYEALRQKARGPPTESHGNPVANDVPGNGTRSDDVPMHDASPAPAMPAPTRPSTTPPMPERPTPAGSTRPGTGPPFSNSRGGGYGPRNRTARSTRTVFTAVVQVSQTMVRLGLFTNSFVEDEPQAGPEPFSTSSPNEQPNEPPLGPQHNDPLMKVLHGLQQHMERIEKRLGKAENSPKIRNRTKNRKEESSSDSDDSNDEHRPVYLVIFIIKLWLNDSHYATAIGPSDVQESFQHNK